MSNISADDQILDWIRKKGQLVIENNSEFYIKVEFVKNKFMYRFGDTALNKDSEVKEMHEIEMLEYIRGYVVRKAQVEKKMKLRNSEDVLSYIRENLDIK